MGKIFPHNDFSNVDVAWFSGFDAGWRSGARFMSRAANRLTKPKPVIPAAKPNGHQARANGSDEPRLPL